MAGSSDKLTLLKRYETVESEYLKKISQAEDDVKAEEDKFDAEKKKILEGLGEEILPDMTNEQDDALADLNDELNNNIIWHPRRELVDDKFILSAMVSDGYTKEQAQEVIDKLLAIVKRKEPKLEGQDTLLEEWINFGQKEDKTFEILVKPALLNVVAAAKKEKIKAKLEAKAAEAKAKLEAKAAKAEAEIAAVKKEAEAALAEWKAKKIAETATSTAEEVVIPVQPSKAKGAVTEALPEEGAEKINKDMGSAKINLTDALRKEKLAAAALNKVNLEAAAARNAKAGVSSTDKNNLEEAVANARRELKQAAAERKAVEKELDRLKKLKVAAPSIHHQLNGVKKALTNAKKIGPPVLPPKPLQKPKSSPASEAPKPTPSLESTSGGGMLYFIKKSVAETIETLSLKTPALVVKLDKPGDLETYRENFSKFSLMIGSPEGKIFESCMVQPTVANSFRVKKGTTDEIDIKHNPTTKSLLISSIIDKPEDDALQRMVVLAKLSGKSSFKIVGCEGNPAAALKLHLLAKGQGIQADLSKYEGDIQKAGAVDGFNLQEVYEASKATQDAGNVQKFLLSHATTSRKDDKPEEKPKAPEPP